MLATILDVDRGSNSKIVSFFKQHGVHVHTKISPHPGKVAIALHYKSTDEIIDALLLLKKHGYIRSTKKLHQTIMKNIKNKTPV